MLVTRKSVFTGKETTRDLDITPEQLKLYEGGGVLIQRVFPNLSPSDREFIMTGATDEDWDSIFGDEEDYDEDWDSIFGDEED